MLRQGAKLVSGNYFPTFSLISGTIYNGHRGVNKYRHHFDTSKLRQLIMFTYSYRRYEYIYTYIV